MSAQTATANQIEAMQPNLVAILGDEQYQVGRYQDFLGSFDHTYGAFKLLQRPSPGNHEFYTSHGETGDNGYGYFDYYNGYQLDPAGNPVTHTFTDAADSNTFTQPTPRPAGPAGQFGSAGDGWYSYNLGNWHIISFNAECATQPGGCSPSGSWLTSETQWLAQDLRQNRSMCTMHYWHLLPSARPIRQARRRCRPSAARRARPPTLGGSCCTPITPTSSSTGTSIATLALLRWTQPVAPIRAGASASSSSERVAKDWTASPRAHPTSRLEPTSTTER